MLELLSAERKLEILGFCSSRNLVFPIRLPSEVEQPQNYLAIAPLRLSSEVVKFLHKEFKMDGKPSLMSFPRRSRISAHAKIMMRSE